MTLRLSVVFSLVGWLPALGGEPPRIDQPRKLDPATLPRIVAAEPPAGPPVQTTVFTLPGPVIEIPEPLTAVVRESAPDPSDRPPRQRRPLSLPPTPAPLQPAAGPPALPEPPSLQAEIPEPAAVVRDSAPDRPPRQRRPLSLPPTPQPSQADAAPPPLPEPPPLQHDLLALARRTPTGLELSRPAPTPRPVAAPASELESDSAMYLQRRLGKWSEADAVREFGEPVRSRDALDAKKTVDGRILAFADPSKRHREFELDFDAKTGLLRAVFVYPWKMRWDDCRRLWGANVTTAEASNGRRFHSYENRRLDVLVDRAGNVISLGLY